MVSKRTNKKPCDSTCPKCGSGDIVRELRRAGETVRRFIGEDGPSWLTGTKWVKEKQYHGEVFAQECIEHHCRGCQYEWCTAPLRQTITSRAAGGHGRAKKLSPQQRTEAARRAANARWNNGGV
jgi:hypothetical protein